MIENENIIYIDALIFCLIIYRLRKVKMDQRKLMDNANTITDMAKVSRLIYLNPS